MKKFRLKNIDILVATDVAARGLDVDSLTHVIHFSLPDDPEVFVHRSGRTGRAGKDGISMALIKPEESRKLKQIKYSTQIELKEKKIPTGKEIIKAQVGGVFDKLFTEHEEFFAFDDSLIPDLEAFSKEELVHKLLQLQLRDLAMFYKDKNDLADQKFNNDDDRGGRDRGRDRDRGSRNERGGDRDRGGRDRDRGGKPRRKNEDMVRFFFNLGKKDSLKKMDMLEIINKSTSKSKKRPDIGNIEILEKFSFFEVEKSFKDEVIKGLQTQKFKGKEMRAEVAN